VEIAAARPGQPLRARHGEGHEQRVFSARRRAQTLADRAAMLSGSAIMPRAHGATVLEAKAGCPAARHGDYLSEPLAAAKRNCHRESSHPAKVPVGRQPSEACDTPVGEGNDARCRAIGGHDRLPDEVARPSSFDPPTTVPCCDDNASCDFRRRRWRRRCHAGRKSGLADYRFTPGADGSVTEQSEAVKTPSAIAITFEPAGGWCFALISAPRRRSLVGP